MRLWFNITLLLLIIVDLTIFSLSFLPFHHAKQFVDSLGPDGRVLFFDHDYYLSLILRLRFTCLLFLFATPLLWFLRPSIVNLLSIYLTSVSNAYRSFKADINLYFKSLYIYNKGEIYFLLFIVLSGLSLRLYYLFTPIRIDEAIVFMKIASKPFFVCISSYFTTGNHVFYTAMVNMLHYFFGDAVWAMRLPALLAGTLLIPATYFLFRTLSNNFVALISATLVSLSSPLIEYSTNARGYTTIILVFLILLLLANYLSTNRNLFAWSLFIVASALGFYTIPLFLLPFGIVICWYILIIIIENNQTNKYTYLKDLLISLPFIFVCILILYLPVIVISGYGSLINNQYVQANSFSYLFYNLVPVLKSTLKLFIRDIPLSITLILALGFLVFLIKIRSFDVKNSLLLVSALSWCCLVILVKRIFQYPRMWLFLIPILVGLSVNGLFYLIKNILKEKLILYSSIIVSLFLLLTLSSTIIINNSIYYSDTDAPLLVDGDEIAQYLKHEINFENRKTYVADLLHRYQMMYYFKRYDLPVSQLLKSDSIEDADFLNKFTDIIVIDNGPNQSQEIVLEAIGLDLIDNLQPPVMLKKFKIASLYCYKKQCCPVN